MCYFRCEFGRYALWSGHGCRPVTASKDGIGLFSFPQEPRWNADRDAVEFPVEIGEYRGLAIVPRRLIHDLIGGHATPEQSVEYVFLNRTEFERMVESKIRAKEARRGCEHSSDRARRAVRQNDRTRAVADGQDLQAATTGGAVSVPANP